MINTLSLLELEQADKQAEKVTLSLVKLLVAAKKYFWSPTHPMVPLPLPLPIPTPHRMHKITKWSQQFVSAKLLGKS